MSETTERSSMRKLSRLLPIVAVASLVIAGCGSSSSSSNGTSAGKNGGTVTILEIAGGVDSLDPGYWYYQTDYTDLYQTTQRALYGWLPNGNSPTPDLATGMPTLADGGK